MSKPAAHPISSISATPFFSSADSVMLDSDLAELYDVQTKALNQAVRRNVIRFPEDFMFQLTRKESDSIQGFRAGSATRARGGNVKHLPLAFTEQGVVMLSSVLRSERAAVVNIQIMRAFVR